jgi:hypothetical protein
MSDGFSVQTKAFNSKQTAHGHYTIRCIFYLFCFTSCFCSFEASNGIKVEESGFVKPAIDIRTGLGDNKDSEAGGDIQVIQGSFSYTAPDGTPINLK